jgi:hypothetical protein
MQSRMAEARFECVERQIAEFLPAWSVALVVEAVQTIRRGGRIVAA